MSESGSTCKTCSTCRSCYTCKSDWIFKAPKGVHHLCEECYNSMSKEVIDYHGIQNEAHKHVINGDVEHAIRLLRLVQEKRNQITKYFITLNEGHYRFANEFIPRLITRLSIEKQYIEKQYIEKQYITDVSKITNTKQIWNDAFATLTHNEL